MDDTQVRTHTDLLVRIHEQLDQQQATELTFFASDDTVLFCASVLAKVSTGVLSLTPEQLTLVRQGLGELQSAAELRPATNNGTSEA